MGRSAARGGRYSNASDLVRRKERARVIEELQTLISQGIESGVSEKSMGDILVAARATALGPE
jgi:antitoxin ParD1/3/4